MQQTVVDVEEPLLPCISQTIQHVIVVAIIWSQRSEKTFIWLHVFLIFPDLKDTSVHTTCTSTQWVHINVFVVFKPCHLICGRVFHRTTFKWNIFFLTISYLNRLLRLFIEFSLFIWKLLFVVFKQFLCIFHRNILVWTATDIVRFWQEQYLINNFIVVDFIADKWTCLVWTPWFVNFIYLCKVNVLDGFLWFPWFVQLSKWRNIL